MAMYDTLLLPPPPTPPRLGFCEEMKVPKERERKEKEKNDARIDACAIFYS
jgi:hypothetical protein